jgi:hypothetical protein
MNVNQHNATYHMLYVKQEAWEKLGQKPRNFNEAVRGFISI